MTEPTDEADTELMPARVYAESWPDTDREDTFWYQPAGAGIDMRTGAASKITVYIREDVCAADIARLQSELAAAKAELADAQRGDPDGHLLAVYQVLRGQLDVAGELFDGEEPHYERVVRAAKEMRAEVERLRASINDMHIISSGGDTFGGPAWVKVRHDEFNRLRELTTPPAPVVRYGDVRFTEFADPVTGEPMWRKETAPVERKDEK